MGLSSNVLWHQTKKDGLMGILKSRKLYYSYSLENIISSSNMKGVAIPMVSLCDLPLAEFGSGKWAYGNYAIGFSREWGINKGFNPVCYCFNNSLFLSKLYENLKEAIHTGDRLQVENAVFPFFYMKFVEGSIVKRNYKRYRFYDEKEIRFVPKREDVPNYEIFLKDTQYDEYKKEHGNSLLGTYGIDFSYEDIKYIIVDKENNKDEIVNFFNHKQVDVSHITLLSKSQVIEDIIGDNHNELFIDAMLLKSQKSVADLALELGREWFKYEK